MNKGRINGTVSLFAWRSGAETGMAIGAFYTFRGIVLIDFSVNFELKLEITTYSQGHAQ